MEELANPEALVVLCCKPGSLPSLSASFPNADLLIAIFFN